MTSDTRVSTSHRLMWPALVCIAVSFLLTALIGVLGPSAMVPSLSGPAWQPPYSMAADPHPYLVISLAAAALVLGGLGLLAALTVPAMSFPARLPRALVLLGCLAAALLAFLPPSGSGDHLNYAGYGRLASLGIDPYTHGADDLPGDPVTDAVEAPWREEPTVYGPVATALHTAASWLAGDSLRLTIFLLALVNAAAFIATGLLIDRFTRDDPAARVRAALLWTANPLLLYQLVAGMHVDTLAIACMVAALLARTRPVVGGALLGLGVAIKLNAGLVALGPAWELRRAPRRLALMAGVALAVVIAGYALAGFDALAPVTRTSKSVSNASFWKLVQGWLQSIVGTGSAYRGEIQIGSLLLLALIAWSLFRLTTRSGLTTRWAGWGQVPSGRGPGPGLPEASSGQGLSGAGPGQGPTEGDSGRGPCGVDSGQGPRGVDSGQGPWGADSGLELPGSGSGPGPSGAGSGHGPTGEGSGLEPTKEGSGRGSLGAGSDRGPFRLGSVAGVRDQSARHGDGAGRGGEAVVVAGVMVVAYLFASPYVLPWYDGLAFGVLALAAASALDRFMVVHLLVLSVAYLPARVVGQPAELGWLTTVVRSQVVPWLLLALTAALLWWAWRAAGRVRTTPASEARPR